MLQCCHDCTGSRKPVV
uniref:Uncharacterized protein n=1 Tax=Arundo donax TaxID=35708 RepID=A0A0A9GRS3_ARUDO